jgi:hypothetical protein
MLCSAVGKPNTTFACPNRNTFGLNRIKTQPVDTDAFLTPSLVQSHRSHQKSPFSNRDVSKEVSCMLPMQMWVEILE